VNNPRPRPPEWIIERGPAIGALAIERFPPFRRWFTRFVIVELPDGKLVEMRVGDLRRISIPPYHWPRELHG